MGLLVLVGVGSILGWLAAIITRRDGTRGVGENVAIGVLGTFIGAALVTQTSLIEGLSATALGLGLAGAVALLGAYQLTRRELAR
ncbi:GlsB/YeaQ/YmgE family stress response membrane protein [Altererythrobacter aerius]|uniref:GlsB/YeaQ/YmgE family stress response membrane protein n=1 Tax=Tsuneonella aeria TaxID=1837929 RepID=A0A6I4TGD6_9SPHN|nr:GlsB/YeaQ/YmgE family stress response membrane protein [Tsuneonella aeria]MXO75568.1 GlsB/YeaQ/YmgE family stress response membrane protein [Tsuneonella aeria]